MLQIGCCINMNATDHDPTGSWSVEHMKSAGFDYIEAPLAQLYALELDERRAVYDKFEKSNLPVLAMNNFFPAGVKLTGPQADLMQIEQYLIHAFSIIRELQAETIVLGSSGSKNIPEGFSREKAAAQLNEAILLIADYAEKYQTTIVIEPLNKKESNFITNSAEGWSLVKQANSQYIKLLVDYYHFALEHEPLAALNNYAGNLLHVHMADTDGRRHLKTEHMDGYQAFVNKLKEINYNRKISLEAYAQSFKEESETAVQILKYLLK